MWITLRALLARRRLPRCEQCGALVEVAPARRSRYVCDDDECREQVDLEVSLGY